MNNIIVNKNYGQKYLPILSMISITFLISAMIFTYRIIEIGPFLTPGGVVPFAITYLIAGMITEIYGYENARKVIFGNFLCIFIFNLTVSFLLKLPTPSGSNYQSYTSIFDRAIYIMTVYSTGFFFGDLVNALCISKWHRLLKGKYFFIRLMGASLIGQFVFSIIVIPSLYFTTLPLDKLFQQFYMTILAKLLVILLFSYPGSIITKILSVLEGVSREKPTVIFNPFSIRNSD